MEALDSSASWHPAAATDDDEDDEGDDELRCNKPKSRNSSLDVDADCGTAPSVNTSSNAVEDGELKVVDDDAVAVFRGVTNALGSKLGCNRLDVVLAAVAAVTVVDMCRNAPSPLATCLGKHTTSLIHLCVLPKMTAT